MTYLENLIQPKRLLLLWQQLDPSTRRASGDRYVVGEIRENNNAISLHYANSPEAEKAKSLGFSGLTAFPISEAMEFEDVSEILSKRLPPPSRSDYSNYLSGYRLPPARANEYTLMQLLAYTGGMLAGDGFSFAYSFDNAVPPYDFTFTIAGFRHNDGMNVQPITSLVDKFVSLQPEPENEHDPNAIAIYENDMRLGYVPKGLTTGLFQKVFSQYSYRASICRINGTPTNPNVMVMVKVSNEKE